MAFDIERCENCCENCTKVNRGHDDCCHEVHWISDRCPLYKMVIFSVKLTKCRYPVEILTTLTGCVHFTLDTVYKKEQEEAAEYIKKLHESRNKIIAQDPTLYNDTCPYCNNKFKPGEELTSNENEDIVHLSCELKIEKEIEQTQKCLKESSQNEDRI